MTIHEKSPATARLTDTAVHEVLVIGAGFSGLGVTHRLREAERSLLGRGARCEQTVTIACSGLGFCQVTETTVSSNRSRPASCQANSIFSVP